MSPTARRAGEGIDRAQLSRLHDLTGRVAVVTGGTRGIGRSIAEGFLAAGAAVAVASRKAEACTSTEEHLRALGGEAITRTRWSVLRCSCAPMPEASSPVRC